MLRLASLRGMEMKSLATLFLIFATCIAVAGTMALIDRAHASLSVPVSSR
jgi:hypothetical protein